MTITVVSRRPSRRLLKMVALSNGSGFGTGQVRPFDGALRQPNDDLLNAEGDIVLRMLGRRVKGSSYNLQVRTNPAGNGDLFWFRQVVERRRIRLRWFGYDVVWQSSTTTNIDKDGQALQPYCVSAGGRNGVGAVFQTPTFNNFNFLNLFGFSAAAGNGNLGLVAHAGFPGLVNANAVFQARSDGGDFGFIPLQSSYDYQAQPLNYNILGDAVATTMSRTPFHALYFNTDRAPNGVPRNLGHTTLTNAVLGRCATCETGYPIRSYLLNREIGDDTLWLENTNAGFPFRNIEAERSLQVNVRNPYYNYPTSNSAIPGFAFPPPANSDQIVESRQQAFAINNAGPNSFRSNTHFIPSGLNPATYTYQTGAMTICCVNYSVPQARIAKPGAFGEEQEENAAPSSLLQAYPNPAADGKLTVKYRFGANLPVTFELYDVMGRKVGIWKPVSDDHSLENHFPLPVQLQPGIYTLKAGNGAEQQTVRLVITR